MRTSLVCVFLMAMGLAPTIRPSTAGVTLQTVVNPTITFSLLDLSGKTHALDQNDSRRVRAFVFLSTECPVANSYLKALNELNAKFPKHLEFYGVVSDPSVTRQQAAKHFAEYRATFPILFDASGLLAAALKPTHAPQAFVLDRDGRLTYTGAIDNAWEALGRRRPKAEKHYLADALTAAADGKAAAVAETAPVGCLIETPPTKGEKAKVTYARDIAPIIQARCLNCHREGQAAPFTLADYDQAARRARQIVRVTKDRIMPPWIPAPTGHDRFVGERWLTDRELELFEAWATTGRAKGDDADLPPAPKFAEGWRLGKPDLIVKMPEPFTVPADGPDLLQNFVIPIDIPEDRLVAAVEFHPGNKRVAHHAVLFLDASGTARKLEKAAKKEGKGPGYPNFGGPGFLPSGALGGWSVGNTPRPLPGGMGRYLLKTSRLWAATK